MKVESKLLGLSNRLLIEMNLLHVLSDLHQHECLDGLPCIQLFISKRHLFSYYTDFMYACICH